MSSTSSPRSSVDDAPDLFKSENEALKRARATYTTIDANGHDYRESLGDLIAHFERLMRETRRLIGHSDRAERELHALAQQLAHRATHDALTGALNRSAVVERTNKELRFNSVMMIVLDIDMFKQVHDDFGHPTGDAVILGVVNCLRRVAGESGFIGRVGGEEFTVLLPGFERLDAMLLAESMREAIANYPFEPPVSRPVTASFGVSANPPGSDFGMAYGLADAALYSAKRQGRNQVVFAELGTVVADKATLVQHAVHR